MICSHLVVLSSSEAYATGLVSKVVPEDKLEEEVGCNTQFFVLTCTVVGNCWYVAMTT